MPVSILIVDDHPVVRHGLKGVLEKQDDLLVVGEASDWQEALAAVGRQRPDVIILDIALQGVDGVSLVTRIQQSGAQSRIIMYSMHSNRDYVTRAFQAGALGYVLKSDKIEQLVEAIRQVLDGRVYLSSSLSETIMSDLLGGQNIAELHGTSSLTPREYEVASLIAQGMTLDAIASTLLVSPQAARLHRGRIMEKLSCGGESELLLKLREYFPQ